MSPPTECTIGLEDGTEVTEVARGHWKDGGRSDHWNRNHGLALDCGQGFYRRSVGRRFFLLPGIIVGVSARCHDYSLPLVLIVSAAFYTSLAFTFSFAAARLTKAVQGRSSNAATAGCVSLITLSQNPGLAMQLSNSDPEC